MPLYLIRHAKAGRRDGWSGPDGLRPLSRNGWRQAERLAERLRHQPITRVLSSPYTRCVQTVEPLARLVGQPVETTDELAEGKPFLPVVDLLQTLPAHAVLCTHGDIIPAAIEALLRRGMTLTTAPDWRKGVLWVLERDEGRIVRAHAHSPS